MGEVKGLKNFYRALTWPGSVKRERDTSAVEGWRRKGKCVRLKRKKLSIQDEQKMENEGYLMKGPVSV